VRNSHEGGLLNRFAGVASALAACAFAAALLMSPGCAPAVPDAEPVADEVAYPTDERPRSSLELIEAAVTAGALEYSTGMLYKIYVMFEPESLPLEYRSDVPSKCGTPIISEVQRNWNLLSPDDRAEIGRYVQPIGLPDDGTQLDDVTPERLDAEREKLD
jgi:hypothetical protein